MSLSDLSLLLGDFAELFQDPRIEDVKSSARAAASFAKHNRTQLAQLAVIVEQRIQEVERDNAVLAMLVTRLLKHLGEKEPDQTMAIIDDIREVLKSSSPAPRNLDFLRQALEFPPVSHTPIHNYSKPPAVTPQQLAPRTPPPPKKKTADFPAARVRKRPPPVPPKKKADDSPKSATDRH